MDGEELAAKPAQPAGQIIRAPAPKYQALSVFLRMGRAIQTQREWD